MSDLPVSGRCPIRLDPIPGESFDGWLDAYGQRLLMSGRELGQALGLPPKLLRLHGANVARGDPALDDEQVAARACGLEPFQVRALWFGLARYDRLVAERVADAGANRRRAVQWFARVLRPMVSSRYCPSCLRGSGDAGSLRGGCRGISPAPRTRRCSPLTVWPAAAPNATPGCARSTCPSY